MYASRQQFHMFTVISKDEHIQMDTTKYYRAIAVDK